MESDYELLVCKDGRLELHDPDNAECWLSTDTPMEMRQ